jgi:DNA-binding MarR family transcriptional regulator
MSLEKASEFYRILARSDSHTVLELKLLLRVHILAGIMPTFKSKEEAPDVGMIDYANMFDVSAATISRHVDNLEARGLVKRVVRKGGLRCKIVEVHITSKGEKMVKKILGVGQ